MDYLDTKKEARHEVILLVGYVLVAIAIVISTLVLLYQSYGFSLNRDGQVIQKGLVFFSSQPPAADIYANGKLQSEKTNARMALPAGLYDITLAREGYHDWKRKINLLGGGVLHYDYPFLVPKKLTTVSVTALPAAPGFMTQSPDRRWLLLQQPSGLKDFTVYDLKDIEKAPEAISLPPTLLTKATQSESWQLIEWADNNEHVLLLHSFDGKTEYILVNRSAPAESLNLNAALATTPGTLTLNDKKYDRYNIYDAPTANLHSASLSSPALVPVIEKALAYKTYGEKTVLYATAEGAPAGKVWVKLFDGTKTYNIRTLSAGSTYVLDLTKYSGDMYVAAGAAKDNKVYIYKDPAGQLEGEPKLLPSSRQVLHVEQVNHLSFSSTAQFIVAENGNRFGVFDIENETGYNYTTSFPIDAPQSRAAWMDGNRLSYTSGGKLVIYDYDNLNPQILMPAASNYLPAFTPDFKNVYAVAPKANGQYELTRTSLRTPADR